MAIKYSNGLTVSTGKPKSALYNMGQKVRKIDASFTKPASTGWANDDVVVLARNLSLHETILNIMQLGGDNIADFTDVNFGFRRSDNGVVLDDNVIADAVSFASASVRDLLGSGLTFDRLKTIGELLGYTDDNAKQPRGGVDLIMTIVAAGTNGGNVPLQVELIGNSK